MRRKHAGHGADVAAFAEHGELRVKHNAAVHSYDADAEESAFDKLGYERADGVEVRVEHQLFRAGFAAGDNADDRAERGHAHVAGEWLQQLRYRAGNAGFGSGRRLERGEYFQVFHIFTSVYQSSSTSCAKRFPRSAKFLNSSNEAQAGESTTASPSFAEAAAAFTASSKLPQRVSGTPQPSSAA